MTCVGFEPKITALERAKAVHTLDSAATVTGIPRYVRPGKVIPLYPRTKGQPTAEQSNILTCYMQSRERVKCTLISLCSYIYSGFPDLLTDC